MEFPGENVSSVLGKLKRLAAVRGKLAVNAQTLYQAVRNGKIKLGDLVVSHTEAQKADMANSMLCLCRLTRVRRWRVGMWDKAPPTTRFVFVRSADGNTLFGFESSL